MIDNALYSKLMKYWYCLCDCVLCHTLFNVMCDSIRMWQEHTATSYNTRAMYSYIQEFKEQIYIYIYQLLYIHEFWNNVLALIFFNEHRLSYNFKFWFLIFVRLYEQKGPNSNSVQKKCLLGHKIEVISQIFEIFEMNDSPCKSKEMRVKRILQNSGAAAIRCFGCGNWCICIIIIRIMCIYNYVKIGLRH